MPDATLGFFGKLPAAGDFVCWNLPRSFTDRWDRWFSMELAARPDTGPLDPRAWRFIVPAGIFGPLAAAGVWRMSEDRAGRRYPFVIALLGPSPSPDDDWFGQLEGMLGRVVEAISTFDEIRSRLGETRAPRAPGPECGPVFWVEDWQVHEARFLDIHDLAHRGLAAMRADPPAEEAVR